METCRILHFRYEIWWNFLIHLDGNPTTVEIQVWNLTAGKLCDGSVLCCIVRMWNPRKKRSFFSYLKARILQCGHLATRWEILMSAWLWCGTCCDSRTDRKQGRFGGSAAGRCGAPRCRHRSDSLKLRVELPVWGQLCGRLYGSVTAICSCQHGLLC